jgi:pimeloyl-ACP methyl ester carboxylesterase
MHSRRYPTLMLACSLALPAATAAQTAPDVAGTWEGSTPIAGTAPALTLRIDVQATADGGIAAVMDVPESKLIRFRVPQARYADRHLTFDVPPGWGLAMFRDIGLRRDEEVIHFEGDLRDGEIAGTIRVAHASFPLTLRARRSQDLPYRKEEVTFASGDVELAGSLFLPAAAGPRPVVVFAHGSGDATRDSWAGEADQLARAGIGALVYDKRGAGKSTGADWHVATFDELAGDVAAAVRYLRGRRDVDGEHIGLFGLSQGTWLIGMAAEQTPVGFLVFASGSGIPVWEQDLYRTSAMMREDGFSEAEIAESDAYQRLKFRVARTGLDWQQLKARTEELKARPARWFDDYAGEFASLASARFWWLAAFRYDPTPVLERTKVPCLVLLGERDLSFPVATVQERMRADFARAGNRDATFVVFPGAEHQIMLPQLYGRRALRRVVSPQFMTTMIDWIRARFLPAVDAAQGVAN